MFFLFFRLVGNRTIGLGDLSSNTGYGWLPLQVVLPLHSHKPIYQQYRALLPYLGFSAAQTARITGQPPHIVLRKSMPAHFPFKRGEYFVVHPFGTSMWRTFPMRRWKSLLTAVAHAHPNLPIIITGAPKDRAQAEDLAVAVPNAHAYIGLPILDVAGIIDAAAFYVGVDTGITHLAGVLEQKSIIISHCGDARWHPLYNPNARVMVNSRRCTCYTSEPCRAEEDGHMCYRCLYDITDGAVLSAVALALSSTSRTVPGFDGWADEYKVTPVDARPVQGD
jgi:ADP-heptose:LPS heptosyltransferase